VLSGSAGTVSHYIINGLDRFGTIIRNESGLDLFRPTFIFRIGQPVIAGQLVDMI